MASAMDNWPAAARLAAVAAAGQLTTAASGSLGSYTTARFCRWARCRIRPCVQL